MTDKYNLIQRILHWLMAIGIISMISLGIFMVYFIQQRTPYQRDIYYLHISVGILIGAMLLIRAAARYRLGAPPLPNEIKQSERKIARFAHVSLYFLIASVIFTGYFMTETIGFPIIFFGQSIPQIFPKRADLFGIPVKPFLLNVHMVLAFSLGALVLVHVSAVIKHHVIDKIKLVKRML